MDTAGPQGGPQETPAGGTDTQRSSGASTPRLKLTLKLSEPKEPAASDPKPAKKTVKRRSKPASTPKAPKTLAPETSTKEQPRRTSTFIERMRALRVRPWRLHNHVAVAVLPPAQPFYVTAWVRPASVASEPASASVSGAPKKAQRASPSVSTKALAGDGPYACPHAGCGRMYDTRLKWRRHQMIHRKRAAKQASA